MLDPAKIGILTVSDRASSGEYVDRGGPAIQAYLQDVLSTPWNSVAKIISDDQQGIEQALIELIDEQGCDLVLTTGGTGPAPRDVTPEATEAVCSKILPGFGEQMRQVSLQFVPTAILSRQTAGVRGQCMIVNLPGQPKAIAECLDGVFPAIPYGVELAGGAWMDTRPERMVSFRPKSAKRPPGR